MIVFQYINYEDVLYFDSYLIIIL